MDFTIMEQGIMLHGRVGLYPFGIGFPGIEVVSQPNENFTSSGSNGVVFVGKSQATIGAIPQGLAKGIDEIHKTDSNIVTITQSIGITVSNDGKVSITANSSTFPSTDFRASVVTTSNDGYSKTQVGETRFDQSKFSEAIDKSKFSISSIPKRLVLR